MFSFSGAPAFLGGTGWSLPGPPQAPLVPVDSHVAHTVCNQGAVTSEVSDYRCVGSTEDGVCCMLSAVPSVVHGDRCGALLGQARVLPSLQLSPNVEQLSKLPLP